MFQLQSVFPVCPLSSAVCIKTPTREIRYGGEPADTQSIFCPVKSWAAASDRPIKKTNPLDVIDTELIYFFVFPNKHVSIVVVVFF